MEVTIENIQKCVYDKALYFRSQSKIQFDQ